MLIHLKQMKLDLMSELENGIPEKQAKAASHDEKEG